MKAAIYNPYLDTLGGGERYAMTFAKVLREGGYKVYVEWYDDLIKEKLESRFGIDLEDINFVDNIKRGDGYDVCFWVSDGSIPALKARKNFLHFQIPFVNVSGKSLINKFKLARIEEIICNSLFTKKYIDKEYGVNSMVLYPPVDTKSFKSSRKENMVLAVGRFSQLTQAKKQDVLIKVFKKMVDRDLVGWRLVLVGGSEVGAEKYLKKLKKMIGEYPIEIIESPKFRKLKQLYKSAKIFWSASGYGVDEEKEPMRVEHFGISVVEAMSAGCVPVVYRAGGHKEIVKNDVNGFLWKSLRGLANMTNRLIKQPANLRKIRENLQESASKYSVTTFTKELKRLV